MLLAESEFKALRILRVKTCHGLCSCAQQIYCVRVSRALACVGVAIEIWHPE